ncbi:MAG TPA: AMP-binding protein [Acidobacteriota bacterium]|jgi:fatty-acyl-CoA synthase
MSIHECLSVTAEKFPDHEALVVSHENRRLTWRELHAEVERTARGLAGLRLKPGDRVGIWATNCAPWVFLQLACARAGVVLVNVNPAYRSHELGFVLKKSGMQALFLRRRDERSDYFPILEQSLLETNAPLQHVVFLEEESWEQMLAAGSDIAPASRSAEDVANIQYTSGTTGSPKGVLLTHRNILNNAWLLGRNLKINERDRVCVPVPLYHCFGCVIGTLVCLVSGAALILPSACFDPLATLRAVEAEKATALYGVPTMFISEMEHPEFSRFNLKSLRTGIMAGSPCPVEVMKRVCDQMHCREITIAYGQTESSPGITMSRVDDSLELRVATVGCALPDTEVKIVSPTGKTVPAGEQGELCTRGYLVMKGYDGEPEATRSAIDGEGWLHTGDLAIMLSNGYFRITGRAKDMIIRGGENIYPREIEEFLYTNPKVADAYVIGLPDAKLGEVVLAWIRLTAGAKATEKEIQEFCRGKIAHFKIPQHVRFVDSFPMTVTGKVQKYRIREQEIRERALEHTARIETA